jgi:hypothetical protein
MSASTPLPKTFAIKRTSVQGYKIYSNKAYQSSETDNIVVSVIKSANNLSLEKARRYAASTSKFTTYIRKWYGGKYNSCSWTFGGSELEVKNTLTNEITYVPMIIITDCCESILPSGAETIQLKDTNIYYRSTNDVVYSAAPIFHTEPYATDSAVSDEDLPVAQVVTVAPEPSAPAMLPHIPAAVRPALVPAAAATALAPIAFPAHVKRLIIADCISRNEVCAITGADIGLDAAVTSCGHVFDSESIRTWLSLPSSKKCCPICKQVCCV